MTVVYSGKQGLRLDLLVTDCRVGYAGFALILASPILNYPVFDLDSSNLSYASTACSCIDGIE